MKPLKLAICSWATGIGGGAGRMESYYIEHYNRAVIEPILISLVPREKNDSQYGNNIPFIQIDQEHRFSHLIDVLTREQVDVVQFQGSFEPLVCEVYKFTGAKVLLEVLHNIECGGLFNDIDHTICVSNAVAAAQEGNHPHTVIPNGIDISEFQFESKNKKSDKIIFLQVGRRSKSKINLDDLAPAILEKIPDAEFWICGGGHTQPEMPEVKVFGVVDNIADLYRQADYFIQLSDNEPFGLVALEAMACGTPVILSNAGGFSEIVESGVDGFLINVTTHAETAEAIAKIVLDVTHRELDILRQNARRKVEQKFDIRQTVKEYEKLILDLHARKNTAKQMLEVKNGATANALVGEALYDFHARNFELLSHHLALLAQSIYYIDNAYCLRTAHEMSLYLFYKLPELYPKGIFTYLFTMGDQTQECLAILTEELDVLIENNLTDRYVGALINNLSLHVNIFKIFIENYSRLGYQNESKEYVKRALAFCVDDATVHAVLKDLQSD